MTVAEIVMLTMTLTLAGVFVVTYIVDVLCSEPGSPMWAARVVRRAAEVWDFIIDTHMMLNSTRHDEIYITDTTSTATKRGRTKRTASTRKASGSNEKTVD